MSDIRVLSSDTKVSAEGRSTMGTNRRSARLSILDVRVFHPVHTDLEFASETLHNSVSKLCWHVYHLLSANKPYMRDGIQSLSDLNSSVKRSRTAEAEMHFPKHITCRVSCIDEEWNAVFRFRGQSIHTRRLHLQFKVSLNSLIALAETWRTYFVPKTAAAPQIRGYVWCN